MEILAILDEDEEYLTALNTALKGSAGFPFETAVFSDADLLDNYLQTHTIRILLLPKSAAGRHFPTEQTIFLTEEQETAAPDEFCKYRPVSDLTEKITKLVRRRDLRTDVYRNVVRKLNYAADVSDSEITELIRSETASAAEKTSGLFSQEEISQLEISVFASLRQLDILSVCMEDPTVTEIMVNGPKEIWLERNGRLEKYPEGFISPEKLSDVIQQIAAKVNRRVNEANPIADARLEDGSRVNIVLPPVAVDGPYLTIRRFPKDPVTMDQLVSWGSITKEAAEFLEKLVRARYNIFISGGTGTGKTTFLGALAAYIPETERVITIEDSAELRLKKSGDVVRLEARQANLEGNYEVTIRDLIRTSLRMRPERIIVGECRGPEALDMLQACDTGHDGSLSTGHANSAQDMLSRLETMVLSGSPGLPLAAIRRQMASALDIMIHLGRMRDGSRKVLGIYEVRGMEKEEIILDPLFLFSESPESTDTTVRGSLVRTELPLTHTDKLLSHRVTL